MKRLTCHILVGLMALSIPIIMGCDWSSGGNSGFNTSRGAGVNINWSGVYSGLLGGGLAVQKTSNGSITRLVINQAGNTVEVTDNQGSHYQGTIGSPGAVGTPDANGAYSAGQELVQSQISFSGKDEVAAKDIEFVGILHAVSVDEINGTETVDESNTENSDETTTTTTKIFDDGTNTVTITVIPLPGGSRTTTVITDNKTGKEVSRTVVDNVSQTVTTTITSTFTLTEQNTQFRLEGTWIEEGGVVSGVDALSRGNASTITTTSTGTGTPQ